MLAVAITLAGVAGVPSFRGVLLAILCRPIRVAFVADHEPDALEVPNFGVAEAAERAGFEGVGHRLVSVSMHNTYYGKKRIASGFTEKYGKMFLKLA
ncbi:hypothetical protein [Mesorhizobium sp. M2D.F.Ca.ET.223.01.1.1]|uniref:hypothetical protein n=1 Tax=Mesorhizobium sp. M2D.F.Ca.ET.223.01.1.1 TaxID=2563940 RepID=UPI001FDF4095|nr:hypothetical protein [Mesorhizobium sp. M2D.F.Ca.ET.223.01.1.1]